MLHFLLFIEEKPPKENEKDPRIQKSDVKTGTSKKGSIETMDLTPNKRNSHLLRLTPKIAGTALFREWS